MLRLAWNGGSGALFAGMPAHLSYQIVSGFRDYLHSCFMAWLQRTRLFTDPASRRAKNGFWLHAVDKACPSPSIPLLLLLLLLLRRRRRWS